MISASAGRAKAVTLVRRLSPFALAYAVLLCVLVVDSSPRRVGDGAEYLAMANNIRRLEPPALSRDDVSSAQALFLRWQSNYVDRQAGVIVFPKFNFQGDGDRRDLLHFWFYPALVAPWVSVTEALDLNPTYAFAIVNALLLVLAAAIVARRLHWALTAFLFVGPIIWWVDKPHTEAFTFALLAIAMVLLRERPWWSFACIGAAATQNPPIALALPLAFGAAALTRRDWLRDRALWAGAIAGVALAALHPIYYLIRLGVLTPTTDVTTEFRWPGFAQLKAPVIDLNLGLVPNSPILALVVLSVAIALLVAARRQLATPTVLVTPLIGLLFLFSFAQGLNVNAGATPSMSRYGLWLIPLAIPLFLAAQDAFGRRFGLPFVGVAALSCALAVSSFNPAEPERFLFATSIAKTVWDEHPGLDNPLAEVFSERVRHLSGPIGPAATRSCSKVLLIGGEGPDRCPLPEPPPASCTRELAFCYANRDGDGYDFVEAPTQLSPERATRRSTPTAVGGLEPPGESEFR
jgi:hypothetical protein